MKKDLIAHFSFLVALFASIIVYKQWFDLRYLSFVVGGLMGTLLPDIDYLIYSYLLYPNESISKDIVGMVGKRKFFQTWNFMVNNRRMAKDLLMHSAFFQVIFAIFALIIITSSGSLLGFGIVLAFMLHLFIDQLVDLIENKNADNWYIKFPINLDSLQRKWFLILDGVVILIFGFLLY